MIYVAIVASWHTIYWANVAGFCIGAALNVVLIRQYVFKDSRYSLPKDILLTMMANGIMLFFGILVLWLLVEHFLISPYGAKLAANGTTFVLNYVTRAIFFRKR